MKTTMTTAPVLRLPDFGLSFVLETDACDSGVGAVLMQKGRVIAFPSQALKPSQLHLSTYEKELIAILQAVDKRRHYLESTSFVIKIDNQSLQHLLDQRLSTHLQNKAELGTSLAMSTAYHPQSDGQNECMSRCLEAYLRAMTASKPKKWLRWSLLAEWWFSMGPPPQLGADALAVSTASVEEWIREHELMLAQLQLNLPQAQSCMKSIADAKRTERSFVVGDMVYLKPCASALN
ncbi:hypothetical protein V2J09_020602 [Rumex salicifolius]